MRDRLQPGSVSPHSQDPPESSPPASSAPGPAGAGPGDDARRRALLSSLRQRHAAAEARGDAETRQALFREAVALNLPPALWQNR
ncbi:MAG: hypothetical protein VKN15_03400 [Cyanobacteriota bacterium]|nr:hypothetical protein [Cyanobacteriota bacterium]